MFEIILYVFVFSLRYSCGLKYDPNDSEYNQKPNIFHLDPFDECLQRSELYCTVEFNLVSDTPSPLLNKINEYSSNTKTNFNNAHMQYGLCVSEKCKPFSVNSTLDLSENLEACLNNSFWNEYKLKTKVIREPYCNNNKDINNIDAGDIIIAAILVIILICNIIGSLYDFIFVSSKDGEGIPLLLAFSIRRSWQNLFDFPDEIKGSYDRRFKFLFAIRTIPIMLVVGLHACISGLLFTSNPHYVENIFGIPMFGIILNGTVVTQTFFVISGFLLVYNNKIYKETKKINKRIVPLLMLFRWIRLTVPYAIVLGFISTLMRHFASGPLWQIAIGDEIADCRKYWWMHLIYVSNYVDNSYCMGETWSLAIDAQFSFLGFVICLLINSSFIRKFVLTTLFLLGIIFTAAHTFYLNLNGVMRIEPESARHFFINDDTFNHVYKRTHTNLSSYVIGLTLGYVVHNWQSRYIDLSKYKKNVVLYWGVLPFLIVLVLLSGNLFIDKGTGMYLYVKAVYAGLIKPFFGVIIAVIIVASAFQYENLIRGFLELKFWSPLSKLSYTAFLLHILIEKYFLTTRTELIEISVLYMVINSINMVAVTFISAVPFWLLIEGPRENIMKLIISKNLNKDHAAYSKKSK